MRLTFTQTAGRDILRLREFIRKKNPAAAKKVSHQLKLNIQALVENPKLGTQVDDIDDVHELVARSYIVRYRLLPDEIVILKIWHGKEDR